MVSAVDNEAQFNALRLSAAEDCRLFVADFFTTWCGPCQVLAPHLERLALLYGPEALFVKVDCDLLPDLAAKHGISRLPTLKGFLGSSEAFTIEGEINLEFLKKQIESLIVMPCLKLLFKKNPDLKKNAVLNYLIKLCNNVINFPNENKYRQLKFSNKSVQQNLLSHEGVLNCLVSIGFNNEKERLFMPMETSTEKLNMFKKQILLLSPDLVNKISPNQSNNSNVEETNLSSINAQCTTTERTFLQNIEAQRQRIVLYENEDLMNIVNVLVDIDSYQLLSSEESVLQKVLRWFKYDFFSWFSPPTCSICSNKFEAVGTVSPTQEESKWLANNVELYQCQNCCESSQVFRFPRYNHPEKLLTSRTGRCGEWANCFSMILRAFIKEGLFEKARFVMDWSDHVWCEIYVKLDSDSERKWIHVDPCECAYNTPLVYKVGWKKVISYVIGVTFPSGDVQDITWRYTNDFKATLQNRRLIRENILIANLVHYHKEAETNIKEITTELLSFLSEKTEGSDNERIGRTTGSLEWRAERGELGEQPLWMKEFTGKDIIPTALELKNNCIHIQYNCSTDQYCRPCDHETFKSITPDGEMLSSSSHSSHRRSSINKSTADLLSHNTENWQSLATSWKNIKRKVEYDWQIVYLARMAESSPDTKGKIKWTIDLTGTNKVIGEISVFASSAEFHNASVKWQLESDDKQVLVNGFVTTTHFKNLTKVSLIASLESSANNKDSNSWQHTQLCRQKSTDFDVKTLQIKVELHDV